MSERITESDFWKWLDELPSSKYRDDVASRLRSKRPHNRYSAQQELFLYHFFHKEKGWQVTPHPTMSGVSGRPDFLVGSPLGRFYVEAVIVLPNKERDKQIRRLEQLLEDLNRMEHRFFVLVNPLTPLPLRIYPRRIRGFLKRELDKLDPYASYASPLTLEYREADEDIAVEFLVIPKKHVKRAPIVGGHSVGPMWIDTRDRIRNAISGKMDRYGKLDLPFVISVYPRLEFPADEDDWIDALFGDFQVVFTVNGSEPPRSSRADSGVFTLHYGGKPANELLSAIMECRFGFVVRQGAENIIRIYHNPFAVHPLPIEVFQGWPQLLPCWDEDGVTGHSEWVIKSPQGE